MGSWNPNLSYCPFILGFSKHWPYGPMLSISLNVRLSVYLSVRVFTFEVPFTPTSQSRMSKFFRDSEFLGKNRGKRWSQIWKCLLKNVLKWQQQKKFFYGFFFFICSLLGYCLNVYWPPLLKVGCPTFLELRNLLGKVLERIGLRFEHSCSKTV